MGDAGQLIGATVNDLVPPEAQVHLLAAQRELLLAVTITVEHHMRQQSRVDEQRRTRRGGKNGRPVPVDIE